MKKIGEEFNVSFSGKTSLTVRLQAIIKTKGFAAYKLMVALANAFWNLFFGKVYPLQLMQHLNLYLFSWVLLVGLLLILLASL